MTEYTCLVLSIVLWFAHIIAQAAFAGGAVGLDYLSGPRDEKREPQGALYPRATRALHNYTENFVPFIAADLGIMVTHHASGWGATIWILCRIVYLPLYLTGASPWRSVVWGLSLIGLLMMLWRLA